MKHIVWGILLMALLALTACLGNRSSGAKSSSQESVPVPADDSFFGGEVKNPSGLKTGEDIADQLKVKPNLIISIETLAGKDIVALYNCGTNVYAVEAVPYHFDNLGNVDQKKHNLYVAKNNSDVFKQTLVQTTNTDYLLDNLTCISTNDGNINYLV